MKKKIRETVFYAKEYSSTSWPSNALDFLEWFSEQMSNVPEEHKNSATVNITSDYDIAEMTLEYTRPETDAEEAKREAIESEIADRQRKSELHLLAELKAKYGEGNQ